MYSLGASSNAPVNGSRIPLGQNSIWPILKPDNNVPTDPSYSTHRWHSAQFRMTMPEQLGYWIKVMTTMKYDTSDQLP